VTYNIAKVVNNHLDSINNTNSDKPILLIFKGFQQDFFQQLNFEKLVSLPTTVDIRELYNSKATLLPELFKKLALIDKKVTWCTVEEYLVLGEDILSLYFTTVILENNIYCKTYPCLYNIPEKHRLLDTYFKEEVEIKEPDQDEVFEIFQRFYGDLKLLDSEWYIVYTDDVNAEGFYPLLKYELKQRKLAEGEHATLELSEEDDEFLILTKKLKSAGLSASEVLVSYTGEIDSFPHRYRQRLIVLQELFNQYNFVLVTKTTQSTPEVDEAKYLNILEKYWGYGSFRDLKMYKDIHDPEFMKETVTISQGQIIDDLVKQAIAANQGEIYKDIFITSPTGAGKSVMFQVPAIYLAEKYNLMTIVISPLIGLMTDQVQGLVNRKVDISATINSEVTPVQKMDIMQKISSGEISILYISPETLLSRSDIAQLIGNRTVGLFVIDEAHIVTTWGKAFRSDYWYLGSYLQRLRKEMQFPVATFTATAIYGGIEDMYAETRDSLNLINPISYFGYVKRDDIEVQIKRKEQTKERFREYLEDKFKILTYRLEQFIKREQKTLVYFPTIGLINQYVQFCKIYGSERLKNQISMYYGPLEKERKYSNYLRFKNNEVLIMLATKAFGMGIDIPDIANVYHFAPTGNVCDYIQEIGRVARELDQGYAYFDFLPKDFVHVNRLHGISTIRKQQLVQVMTKVLQLLDRDKNRTNIRHLLVNAEEFRYIFQQGSSIGSNEDIDGMIDNKLKTALLIIEKDFKAKMGYSPIIARPRSVFSREYFMIQRKYEESLVNQHVEFFSKIAKGNKDSFGDIYSCDMKGLWEKRFQKLSFPQFKYKFHSKDKGLKLEFLDYLLPVLHIQVGMKGLDQSRFLLELESQLDKIAAIWGRYAKNGSYFTIDDVALNLLSMFNNDKYLCENLATILIYSAENYDRLMRKHSNFYNRFIVYNDAKGRYSIQNSGYAGFIDWIRVTAKQLFSYSNYSGEGDYNFEIFVPKRNRERIEKTFIVLGILEAFGLVLYRAYGGDNPEIFMRINSRLQIERSLQDPGKYKNYILENVYLRHKIAVEMLTYLFKNQMHSNTFWENIENYFLGHIPEEVSAQVSLNS